MDRRWFLASLSGLAVGLAGCTEDTDGSPPVGTDRPTDGRTTEQDTDGTDGTTETRTESDEESVLPAAETLLDRHYEALSEMAFASEGRFEPRSAESTTVENSIRSDGAETLLEGTDAARNVNTGGKQTVWFSGNARMNRQTYASNPDGVTPPYIQRITVGSIFSISDFEAVDTDDTDDGTAVYEATSADEVAAEEVDADVRSVDVRVRVADAGYICSLDAELLVANSPESDEADTFAYSYEITSTGDVTVSTPDFADTLTRINGSIAADNSAIVLEHAGGPSVPEGEGISVADADGAAPASETTFPEQFEPGDTAYVYWSGTSEDGYDEATISIGEEPGTVARDFGFQDDDVILRGRSVRNFFRVTIDR